MRGKVLITDPDLTRRITLCKRLALNSICIFVLPMGKEHARYSAYPPTLLLRRSKCIQHNYISTNKHYVMDQAIDKHVVWRLA